MKGRITSAFIWLVLAVAAVAATYYILFSDSPPHAVGRVQVVLLIAAVIGVPLGIRLGTQEKYWM